MGKLLFGWFQVIFFSTSFGKEKKAFVGKGFKPPTSFAFLSLFTACFFFFFSAAFFEDVVFFCWGDNVCFCGYPMTDLFTCLQSGPQWIKRPNYGGGMKALLFMAFGDLVWHKR